jgi:hypothetical protein
MLLIKTAALIEYIHMKRGAPAYTIAKDAIAVILPKYPSA